MFRTCVVKVQFTTHSTPHWYVIISTPRALYIRWLNSCTYCRCLRKHLKCHFFQIEMNNWLLHILSIKVSLIAVSVPQLIYLFLTRCCLFPIPPRTLQRHPCPLGRRQNYLNKDGCGWGSSDWELGKKKAFQFFPIFFFENSFWRGVWKDGGTDNRRLVTVLEKNGLRPAAEILENLIISGIDCKTDYIELSMQSQFNKRDLL